MNAMATTKLTRAYAGCWAVCCDMEGQMRLYGHVERVARPANRDARWRAIARGERDVGTAPSRAEAVNLLLR